MIDNLPQFVLVAACFMVIAWGLRRTFTVDVAVAWAEAELRR